MAYAQALTGNGVNVRCFFIYSILVYRCSTCTNMRSLGFICSGYVQNVYWTEKKNKFSLYKYDKQTLIATAAIHVSHYSNIHINRDVLSLFIILSKQLVG